MRRTWSEVAFRQSRLLGIMGLLLLGTVSMASAADFFFDGFSGPAGQKPPGWRDDTTNPGFNADIVYSTVSGFADVTVTASTFGKTLSQVMTFDSTVYPSLEVVVNSVDPGAAVEVRVQQEVAPFTNWTTGQFITAPGIYTYNIPSFAFTGSDTVSVQLSLSGGTWKSARIDSVRIFGPDTPTVSPTFTPTPTVTATPTQTSTPAITPTPAPSTEVNFFIDHFVGTPPDHVTDWADESNNPEFNAFISYSFTPSYAAVTRSAASTFGKVLSPTLTANVDAFPMVEIQVGSVSPATTWKLGIQELTGAFRFFDLSGSLDATGVFTFDYRTITGLTGVSTFAVQITVEGDPGTFITSDYVRVFGFATPTVTATPTLTLTASPTGTVTPTLTLTASPTGTVTPTLTLTESPTGTATPTVTATTTSTALPTGTASATGTVTPTVTATTTNTALPTGTASVTGTASATGTATPTVTATTTRTALPTGTATRTATASKTRTALPTGTTSVTGTVTSTPTPTVTSTRVVSVTPTNTPVQLRPQHVKVWPDGSFKIQPNQSRDILAISVYRHTPQPNIMLHFVVRKGTGTFGGLKETYAVTGPAGEPARVTFTSSSKPFDVNIIRVDNMGLGGHANQLILVNTHHSDKDKDEEKCKDGDKDRDGDRDREKCEDKDKKAKASSVSQSAGVDAGETLTFISDEEADVKAAALMVAMTINSDPDDEDHHPSRTPTAASTLTPVLNLTASPTATSTWKPTLTLTTTAGQTTGGVIAYPNPARGRVTLAYSATGPVSVTVDLFQVTGERVAHIQEYKNGGTGQRLTTNWEAAGVAPGIYLYRLVIKDAEGKTVVEEKKKIVLLR